MSQPPPPSLPGSLVGDRQAALTPEAVETVLADFRSWLQQAAVTSAEPLPVAPAESIDLHTLLGQFVALKHEVNLQTKAVRAQQEQSAETLRQLGEAVDLLKQAETRAAAADQFGEDELVRPL